MRVNRNYVLTEYVQNENDCTSKRNVKEIATRVRGPFHQCVCVCVCHNEKEKVPDEWQA